MRGGPEAATHCLADDLHALIASRLTVRRVTAGMVCRGDVDAYVDAGYTQQSIVHPAAVRRPHLSFLGSVSGVQTAAPAQGKIKMNAGVSRLSLKREPLYVVRRVLGRRRGRGNGSMELLIEWEDGEVPQPPGRSDGDGIEDDDLGIDRLATHQSDGTGPEDSDLPAGHVHGVTVPAAWQGVSQPQREEVDFQLVGGGAGLDSGAPDRAQWLQKATVERLVGREMMQEAVLAYHRKVSHIARLVASG